jgi:hypothetical protein
MKHALVIVALGLAACSKPGGAPTNVASAPSTAAPSPGPSAKLGQIFTADMLGANVAFLETITGPAFKTDGDERTYKVDGCTVIVGASAGKVDNLGIEGVSPQCNFNIAQYFASGYDHPVPALPTFGDIKLGLGGDYAADCYRMCGNAADPVISLSYEGSHADNFNELVASTPAVSDAVVSAYQSWGDALVAKYGEDAVDNNHIPDPLSDVAAKAFANIQPTSIHVGQHLIPTPG